MENVTQSEHKPMSARYRISERDYVRAVTLSLMPTRRALVAFILFVATLAGIGAVFDWRAALVGVDCGVSFGILGSLAIMYLYIPRTARYSYRRYKLIQGEFGLVVLNDGIRFTSSNGESQVEWNKFFKWRCNADYVLIYPAPRCSLSSRVRWPCRASTLPVSKTC